MLLPIVDGMKRMAVPVSRLARSVKKLNQRIEEARTRPESRIRNRATGCTLQEQASRTAGSKQKSEGKGKP